MFAVDYIDLSEVKEVLAKRQIHYEYHAEKIYALVGGRVRLINAIIRQLDRNVAWNSMLAAFLSPST